MPSRQRPPRRRCARHLAAQALWLMLSHLDCQDRRSQVTRRFRMGVRSGGTSSYDGSSMVAETQFLRFIFPIKIANAAFRGDIGFYVHFTDIRCLESVHNRAWGPTQRRLFHQGCVNSFARAKSTRALLIFKTREMESFRRNLRRLNFLLLLSFSLSVIKCFKFYNYTILAN